MSRTITMLAALALLLTGTGRARAEVIITFFQQGPDVVATTAGSLNLTALTFAGGTGNTVPFVNPNRGYVNFGAHRDSVQLYVGISPAQDFGFGDGGPASSSGPAFGIDGTGRVVVTGVPTIIAPFGFTGGSIQPSTDTWANTNIIALDLTPGTYGWTWGSVTNGNADDLKVVISGIPEPATLTLLGVGAVDMMGYAWRRRRPQAA
jgi:hypothetical protein